MERIQKEESQAKSNDPSKIFEYEMERKIQCT